ncbi:uncharacterized protein [Ovis canadensis]|uniref:uncharacterized protein isoform X1 n=1 Tax=Ovis canadensis TaxID=37174 RepID=UPI00375246E8
MLAPQGAQSSGAQRAPSEQLAVYAVERSLREWWSWERWARAGSPLVVESLPAPLRTPSRTQTSLQSDSGACARATSAAARARQPRRRVPILFRALWVRRRAALGWREAAAPSSESTAWGGSTWDHEGAELMAELFLAGGRDPGRGGHCLSAGPGSLYCCPPTAQCGTNSAFFRCRGIRREFWNFPAGWNFLELSSLWASAICWVPGAWYRAQPSTVAVLILGRWGWWRRWGEASCTAALLPAVLLGTLVFSSRLVATGGHPCCRGPFPICPLCEIVPHGIFPRSAPWPSGALCPSGTVFLALPAFLGHGFPGALEAQKHHTARPAPGDCSDFQGDEMTPSSALQARKSAPCCTQRPQAMLGTAPTLESKDTKLALPDSLPGSLFCPPLTSGGCKGW